MADVFHFLPKDQGPSSDQDTENDSIPTPNRSEAVQTEKPPLLLQPSDASGLQKGGYLRAHEKTGSLDALMVLSGMPLKAQPRTARPEKANVPKASSARDVGLFGIS